MCKSTNICSNKFIGQCSWSCPETTAAVVLPGDEVIQRQAQDGQEEEHGKGPAVPSSIHVDLQTDVDKIRFGAQIQSEVRSIIIFTLLSYSEV